MKYSEDYSLEEILNKIPTHCNPAAVNRKLRPCENCESVGAKIASFGMMFIPPLLTLLSGFIQDGDTVIQFLRYIVLIGKFKQ